MKLHTYILNCSLEFCNKFLLIYLFIIFYDFHGDFGSKRYRFIWYSVMVFLDILRYY